MVHVTLLVIVTAILVKDIRYTRQRINLAITEMACIRANGCPFVADGGFLNNRLDFVQSELFATLCCSLHPQGNNAGDHGRSHRGTRHQAIEISRMIDNNILKTAAVHTVIEG